MNQLRIEKWFQEALDQIPVDAIGVEPPKEGTPDRQIIEEYIRPLLKRCNARSRTRFWTWLRMRLAENARTSLYLGGSETDLDWMKESRCPPEIIESHQRAGFRHVINGGVGVALIEVIDETESAIWKVPIDRLEFALSLYPVFLKRLPDLEQQAAGECRRLEVRLRKQKPTMSSEQVREMETQIAEMRAVKTFAPPPRYELLKYQNGAAVKVHRLFLDAMPNDEVKAVDGDFLNFTDVTITMISEVAADKTNGLAWRPANRRAVETETLSVPNLYIVHCDQNQGKFEGRMFQPKLTRDGDIDQTPLRVQPNADLGTRAQEFGEIVDAGTFEPLTEADEVPADFAVAKVPVSQD